jgi:alpha-ketoglutarate-dependent taurine dioxygenase
MAPNPGFDKFRPAARSPLRLTQETLIRTGYLDESRKCPLVIQPAMDGVDLCSWAEKHHPLIETEVAQHGAILFRGFNLGSVEKFETFVQASSGGALDYKERSSPRSQVSGNIYTSTDYPPSYPIFLHNEQSYNLVFPLRILFFCVTPAETGGETPIADSRRVLARIDPAVRERFRAKGYMYVRNFGDGMGLSWQEAFRTSEPADVEAYGRENDIQLEWKDGGRLRTRQVRHAVARHPKTGEEAWFNHATFFHVTTLVPQVRDSVLAEFSAEDLPNNTCYGDGSPIEPEVMDHLREVYAQETISFPWQQGDVLLLDNMLMSHGRAHFTGPRKILVGMAQPCRWADVQAEEPIR